MKELTRVEVDSVSGGGAFADALYNFGQSLGSMLDDIFKATMKVELNLTNHLGDISKSIGEMVEQLFAIQK